MYQRWWLDDLWFLRYGTRQTDGCHVMDGKWHIDVGAPPKKINISNRVQLSFGWKKIKKRIANQILLSRLCYIGQMYTIPKFINEEIQKTIVQLSIWKCGPGILDIDTQLNSLELQWISRLLNPINALWKGLTLYWLNLKNNSNQGSYLFRQKQILRSSRHKNLQNQNDKVFFKKI